MSTEEESTRGNRATPWAPLATKREENSGAVTILGMKGKKRFPSSGVFLE